MIDEQSYQRIKETAYERYQRDNRFRAIVQSVVHKALAEHGPVDPERADRDAARIAEKVAALVLETVFQQDAELNAQREIADRYREIAEDALRVAPVTAILGPRLSVRSVAAPG